LPSMRDPTAEFFDGLVSMGHVPILHRTKGTIRIDLEDGTRTVHWHLIIDNGDVSVSHRHDRADSVMHTTKDLFDGMATGRVNAMAALLRGMLVLQGDLGLIAALSRLLPGPPRSKVTFLERQKARAAP